MSTQPELVQPPFERTETAFPIPISIFIALQSQDYWDTKVQSWGILRLPPPLAASSRPSGGTDQEWTVAASSNLYNFQLTGFTRTVADLVFMTPNQRKIVQ